MPRLHSFKGAKTDFKPLPKATYDFQIDSVKESTTRNDNIQMQLHMHVAGGQYDGRKCVAFYVWTVDGFWSFKNVLDAAGVEYDEVETGEQNKDGAPVLSYENFDLDELVGKMVTFDVGHREYEGRTQHTFNNPRSAGGAATAEAPEPPSAAPSAPQGDAAPMQAAAQPQARRRVRA